MNKIIKKNHLLSACLFSLLFFIGSADSEAQCQDDRIESLLSSPDRVGYGRNTTGGAEARNFTVVTNTADSGKGSLRDALSQETPLWIIFSPRIYGETIHLDSSINIHSGDITIDGRGENGQMAGITISHNRNIGALSNNLQMLAFRGGNSIVHGITFQGTGDNHNSAILLREGDNYWVDHVTISGFAHHNAIAVGQLSRAETSADLITISNYKVFASAYGILSNGDGRYPDHKGASLTVLKSDLGARDRNPFLKRGQAHVFNNYIHTFTYTGLNSTNETKVLAENNYFSAANANNPMNAVIARIDPKNDYFGTGHIFESGNILTDGAAKSGSINPRSVSPLNVGYNYDLIDSEDVRRYVLNNAGAENASASFRTCKNTPDTPDTSNDENNSDINIDNPQPIQSASGEFNSKYAVIKNIQSRSVTISAGFSKPATAHILWGNPPGFLNARNAKANTRAQTDHEITIDGLQPNTNYQYRAVGVDESGEKVRSKVFYFKTSGSDLSQQLSDSAWSLDSTEETPVCNNNASDPDGDGWGWENLKSCKIVYE